VKQFREQVASRDLGYRALAASLYRELLGPAHELLRGKRTIVIVPDDFLWQLPFQALVDGAGRHVLEDYAVSYAPSLSVLYQMRKVG
jgi:CHAT domain-containing protein